ncbi:carbamate kinase [Anaerocolumna cellulosilytica]|uniref:Carbamate kinase n=1 Tax=Anaerocolumna cellulosilytica TaxID=433286 RepID=A0A6S6R890_9FIRM|nr:carbamate kinase [Anaerocolumna cellulosilytica]MBB5197899.1 carbamate kinase [Anaerocolumna cellulosilytica]BCJ95552.1 carbamate kinase [Anaerocolumna cellulosilytica]
MSKKKLVVALGRNSFGDTFPEQQKAVKIAAKSIADLIEADYEVVITHSNGPQVGMFHTAMTEFSRLDSKYTVAPMSVCSALSQGYIGYDLQNILRTELLNRGIFKPVSTIITQVKVDPFDKAFSNPTKIIGRYMSEEEADLEKKKGNYVVFEEGKGYRRIIASPKPKEIYEIDAIQALIAANQIVIAAGGGGIPVLEQGTILKGASAVIEKDDTSELLAELVDAEVLLFLTGVEKVSLNYGKEEEQPLDTLNSKEVQDLLETGVFEAGSILPKVEASLKFVTSTLNNSTTDRRAIITHVDQALNAVHGKTGTHIIK